MPIPNQPIGQTTPKSGTFQYSAKRLDGLTFIIPDAAGVSSVPNTRIVTIQQDTTNNILYAVLGAVAITYNYELLVIVGSGVLEEALQSGGINSISPTPNTFVTGDTVTVLTDPNVEYMIDYDSSNAPTLGIASARVDAQGRLTSAAASGPIVQLAGAISSAVPGIQMANQLKQYSYFYRMKDGITL